MTAATAKEWQRGMLRLGLAFMPMGVALMGFGAYLGGVSSAMTGYLVGSVGVTLLVLGALFGKFGVWGPVPERFRGAP